MRAHPIPVSFYFDPISPYAWLAASQLGRIEAAGAVLRFEPVLFAGLLNAHGSKGPAEIPAKRAYTFRDVMRQAALLGLPFRGPPGHPFNPLLALRMCMAIEDGPQRRRFADALLAACWERGDNLAQRAVVVRLANACGLDGARLADMAQDATVKQALLDNTNRAIEAGVFGVPTFRVGDELFWGGDRMEALLRHLEGVRIDEAQLAAFLALAPSATRKPA